MKIIKKLRWAAYNAFGPVLITAGIYFDIGGFEVLGIMAIWVTIIIGLFGFSQGFAKEVSKKEKNVDDILNQRSMPIWVDVVVDIVIVVYLAYVGYPITGFFFLLHILGYNALVTNVREIKEAKEEIVE